MLTTSYTQQTQPSNSHLFHAKISNYSVSLTEIDIIKMASRASGADWRLTNTPTRKRQVVLAITIASVYIYSNTKKRYEEIGKLFNRDHSTMIHAHRRFTNMHLTDKLMKETLSTFINLIKEHDPSNSVNMDLYELKQ